jgi:hypothetical protein
MTEQKLLEKLTGVNNPRFITPREDAIIKECLTIINELEAAISVTRCSLQFNALLQKKTEVIYKSVKYYIFLIDYNKEVASIKQVEGTWIEYNIPFKELTKSI